MRTIISVIFAMHRHSHTSKHQVAPGCLKIFIDPSLRIHHSGLLAANYYSSTRRSRRASCGRNPPPVVRASRESPTLSPTLSPTDDTPAHARDVNPPWPFRACPARCDRRSATTPGHDTRARRRRRRARARTRWCTVRAIPTTRMTGPLSTGRRPAPASLVRPPRCPSPTVRPERPPPRSRARSTPVCRPSRRVVIAPRRPPRSPKPSHLSNRA